MVDNKRIGLMLYAKGDYEQALEKFEEALDEDPNDPELCYQVAVILAGRRDYGTALHYSSRAVALDPVYGGYRVNYGAILGAMGRTDEAVEQYRLAVRLSPNSPVAHWNLAFEQLKNPAEWKEGWKNYAYRKLHSPGLYYRSFLPRPPKGEDCRNKVLLVHAEQGLGDAVFGFRFLKNLKSMFKKVYFEVSPQLVNLFHGHPYVDMVFGRPLDNAFPYPDVDYDITLLDLPEWLDVEYGDLPEYAPPYLHSDVRTVEAFGYALPEGKNIGVCWHGSRSHANDVHRSMPCELLEPLREKGNLVALTQEPPTIDMLTGDGFLSDAKYTLAFCECMDAIATVDTFVANLCGAAGIPCFVMHHYNMEWRWHHPDIYPSCVNVKQEKFGDWESVVKRIVDGVN